MARKYPQLSMTDLGNRAPGMFGDVVCNLTNDAATTAVVQIGGCPFGRIRNVSAAIVTITFTEAHGGKEGTSCSILDEDNSVSAISTFTIPINGSRKLPTALEGVNWLILTSSAATATVTLHLER